MSSFDLDTGIVELHAARERYNERIAEAAAEYDRTMEGALSDLELAQAAALAEFEQAIAGL